MLKRLQPIHFILLLGLALRLLHCYFMSQNNPLFNLPIVDAKEYVEDATFYNDVNWLGAGGSYFHPPGYSYFIGIIFLFFGKSLLAIRMLQIGIDVQNIYLIFLIAQSIFNNRVAVASAFIYAIYVRMIQYSIEILPPVIVVLLLLGSIYFLLRSGSSTGGENNWANAAWMIAFSAFFLGLLIITLPNFLLVIPAFCLWIYFTYPGCSKLFKGKLIGLFLAVCLLPVFLTGLRNRLVADEGLLISRNGGINFFIGNNPDIKKTVGATPGIEWDKLLMLPYQTQRTENFQEQDDFFKRQAWSYVTDNPLDWLKITLKKTLWYFNAYEFPRNFDVYYFAAYSPMTKYPVFNLALLFPLALGGMLLNWRSKNNLLLIGIFGIYSFSIILIFIAARYRLPVIPIMIIFAGAFLVTLYEHFSQQKIKQVLLLLFIPVTIALITQPEYFFDEYPYTVSPVFTQTLIANTLINAGQREEGKKYLDGAVALPTDASSDDAWYELAHWYRGKQEVEKARECFYKSVQLNPLHYKSWNSLGFDYKMEKNFTEAILCLKKGITIAPCFPELYLNMADCYLGRHDADSAVIVLESYYKNCPSPHPSISESLGKVYMDILRDFGKAAKYYEETIAFPQGFDASAETYNRLGACRFKLAEYKKAKEAWTKGLALDPGNKAILVNIEHAKSQVEKWEAL